MTCKLIIHGGLGTAASFAHSKEREAAALRHIAEASFAYLTQHSALEAVIHAVSLLEDDPLFNAGTGSKIQSDGIIRMTASVMDGATGRFSGVINIRDVKNPVQVAATLLDSVDRVLCSDEAITYARQQGFLPHNPETPATRAAYQKRQKGAHGTVGCVALDDQGRLAAATSTGGKGFEIPGRVSDSSTVAGNYANAYAAVSCTGIGEDIVDVALAARIVTRVTDGMSLAEACGKTMLELAEQKGSAAMIALDRAGNMHHAASEPYLAYAMCDGKVTVF